KSPEGQAALHRLIRELDADVFCCNTIPGRYEQLGIDYETLRKVKPDLIWAGISAMGPDHPTVPGYDPISQAMAGYMEVTGFDDGPPTMMGIPLVDLKAGDEVYANVLLALAEGADRQGGRRIDVSMLQAAASWLVTLLPLIDLDCGPEEITRWGNAHRKFIPTNVYPTSDGHIFVAVGSNAQWKRLTDTPLFSPLSRDGARDAQAARYEDRQAIYREFGAILRKEPIARIAAILSAAQIPNAPIRNIRQVHEAPEIRARMTRTTLPDGRTLRMQPRAVDLPGRPDSFSTPPAYGQHTRALLQEAGLTRAEIDRLVDSGVAATGT
ncbi:CaiB/BaiF CoA transferase family protein, partial [Paracoccus sp. (in: a-proteobacteria)]|uniref:CaiB/BaiF CoA transferase family protein n=1 Tax=Paracoccus sp. TaxID=267 RepID=UPI003A88785C